MCHIASPAQRRILARPASVWDERGFTLIEMTTSVAVLLVVLTAAWLLLTVSNDNLNRIDYGGQASELNRAALATFERDLNHATLPLADVSPILDAQPWRCSILVDENNDGNRQLVTWLPDPDPARDALLRVVTRAPAPPADDPAWVPTKVEDFTGGQATTTTVLTGLDSSPAMFTYRPNAQTGYSGDRTTIGLVTFHLRNGLPDSTSNLTDRSAAFRVTVFVINGYAVNGN